MQTNIGAGTESASSWGALSYLWLMAAAHRYQPDGSALSIMPKPPLVVRPVRVKLAPAGVSRSHRYRREGERCLVVLSLRRLKSCDPPRTLPELDGMAVNHLPGTLNGVLLSGADQINAIDNVPVRPNHKDPVILHPKFPIAAFSRKIC